MKRSELITIGGIATGLFASTIGSALYLSFKIGGVNERLEKTEKNIERLTTTTDQMQLDITDIKVKIAEMEVKIDVLWHDHLSKASPITASPKDH